MRLAVLMTGLFVLPISAFCQSQPSRFEQRAEQLSAAFHKVMTSPDDAEACRAYFKEFPSTFAEFDLLYGYGDTPSILYDQYVSQVDSLFRDIHCVTDSTYLEKILGLGIGGHWDADAVNSLQDIIHERTLANPRLTFELLSPRSDEAVSSFFYFFFNGIHAPYKKIPKEFLFLKKEFPRVYQNLVAGFQHGVKESGH
jgi:hypothetical protein